MQLYKANAVVPPVEFTKIYGGPGVEGTALCVQMDFTWIFKANAKCNITLQSLTGPVQGQNRVFPVKFSTQFSLHGTPVLIPGTPVFITGISL